MYNTYTCMANLKAYFFEIKTSVILSCQICHIRVTILDGLLLFVLQILIICDSNVYPHFEFCAFIVKP